MDVAIWRNLRPVSPGSESHLTLQSGKMEYSLVKEASARLQKKILVLAKFQYHTNVPLGVCDRHTEMASSSTNNGGLADSETLNIPYSPCFPYNSFYTGWFLHGFAHASSFLNVSMFADMMLQQYCAPYMQRRPHASIMCHLAVVPYLREEPWWRAWRTSSSDLSTPAG